MIKNMLTRRKENDTYLSTDSSLSFLLTYFLSSGSKSFPFKFLFLCNPYFGTFLFSMIFFFLIIFNVIIYIMTFIHGIFLAVSSVSLLSLGLSGGWSSLSIPGDSSPLTSPPTPCSDVSLLSDKELTFLFDCTESVRLTVTKTQSTTRK
jgi:hypothetical protein